MFRVRERRENILRVMVVALILLCLAACAVNMQLYLEHRVAVNIVTRAIAYTNRPNRSVNYFDMSLSELMEVIVASKSDDERPSSFLLKSKHSCSDLARQPI
jgi:hypothetical protein